MSTPKHLEEYQKLVQSGERPVTSPRNLLAWFGAFRRGPEVVSRIRQTLAELGLETQPDFESVYIDDGTMAFVKAQDGGPKPKDSGNQPVSDPTNANPQDDTETPVGEPENHGHSVEPTFKIRRLKAANRMPVSVKPQDSIDIAITKMMKNDFSQLPVMHNKRDVVGMISWRSIGKRYAISEPGGKVDSFCESYQVLYDDQSIFTAIDETRKHDSVLVRKRDTKEICGIITNADLGEQLNELSKPFLLISEIENSVNALLMPFAVEDLIHAVHRDTRHRRNIENATSLTFGEKIHFIKKNRKKLAFKGIDHQTFVDMLFETKDIRNDVMHFDPDGLTEAKINHLHNMSHLFQDLRKLNVLKF